MHRLLACSLDPALLFHAAGLTPDPWQEALLRAAHPRILLNCSRQAGKSTTVAALALGQALFTPRSLVLLLSRSQRQSGELFRKVLDFYTALGQPIRAVGASSLRLELANGSRVLALPGHEATIRSFSGVDLLAIDEAARVPGDLYRAVRPMLAVSRGRIVCLSTPFGQRGFFWREWHREPSPWLRIQVTAAQCPRIDAAFRDEERRTLGESWYRQEYECQFAALEGLVYPEFGRCIVDASEVPADAAAGARLGGIDFGFRNPFAAVWGCRAADDVLWLTHEHYARGRPLREHAQKLPRDVTWYADPAGRTEIEELRCAGFVVRPGDNTLRAGLAAVTARIETGRLKVLRDGCPNLLREASLYRYPRPDERRVEGEDPVDAHNHALAALRYLVSRLDRTFLARARRAPARPEPVPAVDDAGWWTPVA